MIVFVDSLRPPQQYFSHVGTGFLGLNSTTGLENSTRPLIFTSASGCKASENYDISSENQFFSHICQ